VAELRMVLSGLADDRARSLGNEFTRQLMQLSRDDFRVSYRCDFVPDEALQEERLAARRDEADARDGAELAQLLRRLLRWPGERA